MANKPNARLKAKAAVSHEIPGYHDPTAKDGNWLQLLY